MKSNLTKLLAVLMAVTIIFSLAACGKKTTDDTTAASDIAANDTTAAAGDTTAAAGDTTAVNGTTGASDTTAINGTTGTGENTTKAGGTATTVPATTLPTTKAQILAAYTAVMNKAKADKPGFKKYEYQELPSDAANRNITGGSAVINPLLKLAAKFMTTEDAAKSSPGVYTKNGDMHAFPVKNADKGCLLTDVSAIKTASCEKVAGGNYKITMVLNDEKNPEHYISGSTAPSKTGGIFVPLSKSDVAPELDKWYVKMVVSNPSYDMNYYNCKVTLIYNPVTQKVVSVDQVLYNKLTLSGKVAGISASGWTVLVMHYNIMEVTY